ncbi:GNAT family N-acetyltransferase [Terriglobus saanensis]|uniref:GCN5-related N-acetyltransferase n=1 Tax=Terriglobus saanensis (strain ATCC BAA-1853 / DSM 23119 / SP1PR4) TaxID=401053 RepID=E8V3R4_TERSS|nr:GNAT family N-acetyltransferase [Terriglobus saanensis]ADV84751.1 GCN5-related N-acetyltransferase [Terriglobus saanensis SP1PR4]
MTTLKFHLRACSVVDSDLLSLVGSGTLIETFAGILDGSDLLAHCQKNNSPAAFTKYLSAPTTRAFFAEAEPGDAPVGYILLCEPDLPVDLLPADYELRRIYLFHRFHGTGIGRALMNQAVEATREMGRRRLLLGVNCVNFAAISFYEKAGFKKVGERQFIVGATACKDDIMALTL